MRVIFFLLAGLILVLAGCNGLPIDLAPLGQVTATLQATPANPAPLATQVSDPQETEPAGTVAPPGQVTLRLWLPPQFDPNADTPAAKLLQNRLAAFTQANPGVRLEVRVKAADGPGGLYESLAVTTAAAELAMPDLVALPHPLIQSAAVKGLLRPMNGVTDALDDPDWYGYARQLAALENSIFGLPFAGDALVQAYYNEIEYQPATDWAAALQLTDPLAFAAADPQALTVLALYQAAGGKLLDEQGSLALEAGPLTQALEFLRAAEAVEVTPVWLTQFQNDAQVLEALREKRAGAAITWLSSYKQQALENGAIAQIPTPTGQPFSMASGWAWTLTSPDPNRRQLAVALAEFLSESSFLGDWSEAAGFLPTRPSALQSWTSAELAARLEPIAASAIVHPPAETTKIFGPALSEATVKVLKRQLSPAEAAQEALNHVNLP